MERYSNCGLNADVVKDYGPLAVGSNPDEARVSRSIL
jgi:hypothetical protein